MLFGSTEMHGALACVAVVSREEQIAFCES